MVFVPHFDFAFFQWPSFSARATILLKALSWDMFLFHEKPPLLSFAP